MTGDMVTLTRIDAKGAKGTLGGSNRLLNSREVGELLGLPERTIRAEWKNWGLRTYRVGRALRWRERDVMAWIESRKVAA
jgi:excisionase family DNA binding protein